MLRFVEHQLGGAPADDPLLPVLQDPLCRAGQRDRADRAQGALRQLPAQLVPGPAAARPQDRRAGRAAAAPPRRSPRDEPRRRRRPAQPTPRRARAGRCSAAKPLPAAPQPGQAVDDRRDRRRRADDRRRASRVQVFGLPDSASGSASRCRRRARSTIERQARAGSGWRAATSCSTVRGEITNQTDRSSACPQIRAELKDAQGRVRLQLVDRAAGARAAAARPGHLRQRRDGRAARAARSSA